MGRNPSTIAPMARIAANRRTYPTSSAAGMGAPDSAAGLRRTIAARGARKSQAAADQRDDLTAHPDDLRLVPVHLDAHLDARGVLDLDALLDDERRRRQARSEERRVGKECR